MKNVIILCSPTSEDFRAAIASGKKGYFFPPLGLLLVAQTLKNEGYEIKFYDGNYDTNYKRDIFDYVSGNSENILYIGFYLTLLQIKDCTDIINAVKSIKPDIPIIIGGPFTAVFTNMVMQSGMVEIGRAHV